jgi:hypothetical protein
MPIKTLQINSTYFKINQKINNQLIKPKKSNPLIIMKINNNLKFNKNKQKKTK